MHYLCQYFTVLNHTILLLYQTIHCNTLRYFSSPYSTFAPTEPISFFYITQYQTMRYNTLLHLTTALSFTTWYLTIRYSNPTSYIQDTAIEPIDYFHSNEYYFTPLFITLLRLYYGSYLFFHHITALDYSITTPLTHTTLISRILKSLPNIFLYRHNTVLYLHCISPLTELHNTLLCLHHHPTSHYHP